MIIVMLTVEQAKGLYALCRPEQGGSITQDATAAVELLKKAIEQYEGRVCAACGKKK